MRPTRVNSRAGKRPAYKNRKPSLIDGLRMVFPAIPVLVLVNFLSRALLPKPVAHGDEVEEVDHTVDVHVVPPVVA